MAGSLNGKVAVVTGASSGIGGATVRSLASEGAAVVAGARRKARLHGLVEEVTRDGAKAIAVEQCRRNDSSLHLRVIVQRLMEHPGPRCHWHSSGSFPRYSNKFVNEAPLSDRLSRLRHAWHRFSIASSTLSCIRSATTLL